MNMKALIVSGFVLAAASALAVNFPLPAGKTPEDYYRFAVDSNIVIGANEAEVHTNANGTMHWPGSVQPVTPYTNSLSWWQNNSNDVFGIGFVSETNTIKAIRQDLRAIKTNIAASIDNISTNIAQAQAIVVSPTSSTAQVRSAVIDQKRELIDQGKELKVVAQELRDVRKALSDVLKDATP